MAANLAIGQGLKGRTGTYTVTKQLHDCVWSATYAPFRVGIETIPDHNCRSQHDQKVVAKSVNHFRLQNERDTLLRFQSRTPYIRPLIDEVEASSVPHTIILKYLDDNLLHASNNQRLTRLEVRHVAKKVLEALSVLY
jgi:hypothetical protein